jgi:hypothetical protein
MFLLLTDANYARGRRRNHPSQRRGSGHPLFQVYPALPIDSKLRPGPKKRKLPPSSCTRHGRPARIERINVYKVMGTNLIQQLVCATTARPIRGTHRSKSHAHVQNVAQRGVRAFGGKDGDECTNSTTSF